METLVIGGGQAGLSVGYHLARRGLPFLIVEGRRRVGDSWRERWDSLRLFTPARYDGLDGLPFPAPRHSFPTKDEMADYLEAYVERFQLPVRTGVRIDRLSRNGQRFVAAAGDRVIEADNVVVAMATFQKPRVPAFARELAPHIRQLHSAEYRNPSQLQRGDLLVAGAANSGAEIALELCKDRQTWLAGRDVGHVPFRIDGTAARLLLPIIFRVVFHRILTTSTPMGRKLRTKVLHGGQPLIRVKPADLDAAGVRRASKVVGVKGGKPLLSDGSGLDVANVIWCTGFTAGFSWIDLPIFDDHGLPIHQRGVVSAEPGLYFVGMHFLHALSSTMIQGVGRDAAYIAEHVVLSQRYARQRAAT